MSTEETASPLPLTMSTQEPSSPSRTPKPTYNRDAIITSLTRYYRLLSHMISIRPSHIHYPPPSGWPDSTIPLLKLQRLGFNDLAIDFIRHLPYYCGDRPIYPGTEPINYLNTDWTFHEPEENYRLEEPDAVGLWPCEGRIPEGVVPLSKGHRGDPGYTWWILETDTGELTPHDAWLCRPEEEVPENEGWRSARPVPATEYFNGLHDQLLALEMIPLPACTRDSWDDWEIWSTIGNVHPSMQKWVDEAQSIYRKCHWPNLKKFKRQRCRRLLVEMQNRRSDESAAERATRPPPVPFSDIYGNPVSPPPEYLERLRTPPPCDK